MSKQKITRVERFKDEIEESKMYQSIEQKTIEDSKLIQNKKSKLQKMDPDFFVNESNENTYKIQGIDSKANLDYTLKSKISNIEKIVSKEIFEIPKPKLLKKKITVFKNLSEISHSIKNRIKNFENKSNIQEINFSTKLYELKKLKEEMGNNSDHFTKNVEDFEKIQTDFFDETQNIKLRINNTREKYEKKELKKFNKQSVTKIMITISTLIIIMIFIWNRTGL